jgi:AraC-like DNA-binding protein
MPVAAAVFTEGPATSPRSLGSPDHIGTVDQAAEFGFRERPTYSSHLLRAFTEVLEEYGDLPRFSTKLLENMGERVLVEVAHQALSVALEVTHDADLGLRAARRRVIGDAGAFDYVVNSSPTVRDALAQASRYIRLINDALDVIRYEGGDLAVMRFESSVVLPRAAVDFQLGSFFNKHVKAWLGKRISDVVVHFAHQAPEKLNAYERTFGSATVRFSAPFVGLSFDRAFLELELPSADPNLHGLLLTVADEMLHELARTSAVTSNVRRIIHARLQLGAPEIADVASELAMSKRTLTRRLEREGTTFRELVDEARRKLALDCTAHRDIGFSELSYLLGYAHVNAFHRAFRRWTGETPRTYRRQRAGR